MLLKLLLGFLSSFRTTALNLMMFCFAVKKKTGHCYQNSLVFVCVGRSRFVMQKQKC